MEQIVAERAGSRLKSLRMALGFKTRPAFETALNFPKGRFHNLENFNSRLNEDDFYLIGKHYPWALEYLAVGGDLIIPEGVDAPAAKVGKAVGNVAAAGEALAISNPQDLMKALTSDPAMKAAFQEMMVEILQQGLGAKDDSNQA